MKLKFYFGDIFIKLFGEKNNIIIIFLNWIFKKLIKKAPLGITALN